VAAGAIAEKYLRQVYGTEIVCFVSSVGKVHLPFLAPAVSAQNQTNGDSNGADLIGGTEADDDAEEQLSDEYMAMLNSITREEVDKRTVRCPHAETAERMEQVRADHFPRLWNRNTLHSASSEPRLPTTRSAVP
jgi:chorismate synthase